MQGSHITLATAIAPISPPASPGGRRVLQLPGVGRAAPVREWKGGPALVPAARAGRRAASQPGDPHPTRLAPGPPQLLGGGLCRAPRLGRLPGGPGAVVRSGWGGMPRNRAPCCMVCSAHLQPHTLLSPAHLATPPPHASLLFRSGCRPPRRPSRISWRRHWAMHSGLHRPHPCPRPAAPVLPEALPPRCLAPYSAWQAGDLAGETAACHMDILLTLTR